ncbi:unnamed protein product [Thlaspi arvense]|uniref:Uncharacterized protein n=1 Tax=Thlaspi arvense TaxID=13288 RepID=A0AAU9SR05_THLAR|nr:unnamed protein product [Thlaspi arvense]
MYSLLLDTYIKDNKERDNLFCAIKTIPCITKKAQCAKTWIDRSQISAERIVVFACIEGIFFSGSFCSIFWLKKRRLMPGLAFSNKLISQDEGIHCNFACLIYTLLRTKLLEERVKAIVCDVIEIEREFVCDALSCVLVGMNRDLMSHYIKFGVDRLLDALRYGKVYDVANPFDWMDLISLEGKTKSFQKRVGVYQKSSVMTKASFSRFAKFKEENIYNNRRLCPLMNSKSTMSKPNHPRIASQPHLHQMEIAYREGK